MLAFDAFRPNSLYQTSRFRRPDTDETVEMTYHVGDVPDGGPVLGNLQLIIEGTESDDDHELFTVTTIES